MTRTDSQVLVRMSRRLHWILCIEVSVIRCHSCWWYRFGMVWGCLGLSIKLNWGMPHSQTFLSLRIKQTHSRGGFCGPISIMSYDIYHVWSLDSRVRPVNFLGCFRAGQYFTNTRHVRCWRQYGKNWPRSYKVLVVVPWVAGPQVAPTMVTPWSCCD